MLEYIKKLIKECKKFNTFPNPLNIFKPLGREKEEKYIEDLILYAFLSGHISYYITLIKRHTEIFHVEVTDLHRSKKDSFFFSLIFTMLFLATLIFLPAVYKIFPVSTFVILSVCLFFWILMLLSINYIFMVKPLADLIKAHLLKMPHLKVRALNVLSSFSDTLEQEKKNVYKMSVFIRIINMNSAFPNDVYEKFKKSNNPYQFITNNWSFYNLKIFNKAKKMFMTNMDQYILSEKKNFKNKVEKNVILVGVIVLIMLSNILVFIDNADYRIIVAISVALVMLPIMILLYMYIKNISNAKNRYVNELFKRQPDLKGTFYSLYETDKIVSVLTEIKKEVPKEEIVVEKKKKRL